MQQAEHEKAKRKNGATGSEDKNLGVLSTNKRQRVSRACDQCRAAREKCDGIQPTCFTCASSNRVCSYTSHPKRRGIQPGYIKSLEISLAWLFSNFPDSEDALHSMLSHESGQGRSMLIGKESDNSYKLQKRWRKSVICKEVDRLLSGREESMHHEDVATEDSDDEVGPGKPQRDSAERPDPLSSAAMAGKSPQVGPENIDVPQESLPRSHLREMFSHQLPENSWHLLDIYFAYTHCWFPISEKNSVLKTIYNYTATSFEVTPNMVVTGDHAELWSILTIAAFQEQAARTNSTQISESSDVIDPMRFYSTARALIPDEKGSFDIGHVKALLLLSLVNLGQNSMTAAWILVGQAVRVAIAIGLNDSSKSSQRNGSTAQLEARSHHTFFGCYFMDTMISSCLGHPPHLRNDQIRKFGPLATDGLEEWDPWTTCRGFADSEGGSHNALRSPVLSLSTFNFFVQLLGYFNDLNSAYSHLLKTEDLVSRIQNWINQLPSTHDSVRTGHQAHAPTPPLLNLRILYLCATIMTGLPSCDTVHTIASLMESFSTLFGSCVIPPLFSLYLTLIENRKGAQEYSFETTSKLNNIQASLTKVWKPALKSMAASLSTNRTDLLYSQISRPFSFDSTDALSGQQLSLPTPLESSKSPETSINQLYLHSSISRKHGPSSNLEIPRVSTQPPQMLALQQYQPRSLESVQTHDNNFNSFQSQNLVGRPPVDVDALFDELASLDNIERLDNRPQFMQNLGFAPGADINEILLTDFPHFDPMLSPYDQQVFGANSE